MRKTVNATKTADAPKAQREWLWESALFGGVLVTTDHDLH